MMTEPVSAIQPVYPYVLIEPLKVPDKSDGGIVLPVDARKKEVVEGKVVAVPAATGLGVEVGDTVGYGDYSGEEFGQYKLIAHDELLYKREEVE